ncbi:hypothetical protein [Marinobacter sp. JSM 1782161]|uniref:hypothetical protein n=1 Tax=Marinobacter sp. JSM 1782161 TaxID=2685906 RepID=UPI001401D5FD|nr:hypothetical protein [Marinobacter sp. JSM 1782161]
MNNMAAMKDGVDGYYGNSAYHPDKLPKQRPQHSDPNQSALKRMMSVRLPWGNADDVAPDRIYTVATPQLLRRVEQYGNVLDSINDQGEMDHECFRFAPLAKRVQILDLMEGLSKLAVKILVPLTIVTLLLAWSATSNDAYWQDIINHWLFFACLIGIPGGIWLISDFLIKHCLRWILKAGKGPIWELNRRTGIVTVWKYPFKIPFFPRGKPDAKQFPFIEFDAWVSARADRYGALNRLRLFHRYSQCEVDIGAATGDHSLPESCYAMWDFIQNYMDVSRPLPDIPVLEPYRHKDPVTAEHDRQTNRPERYWRDMDDETFKARESEMNLNVRMMSMLSRENIMAGKVVYSSS